MTLPDSTPTALPDWLARHAPADWIRQGLSELGRAEARLRAHDRTAGILGLQRAAGMALNAALCVRLRGWGRTYAEHLRAVAEDLEVPHSVRSAARLLTSAPVERHSNVVRLTVPSETTRLVEATKTVMAHAYALAYGSAGKS
jgi:HEPN domain-containing protein